MAYLQHTASADASQPQPTFQTGGPGGRYAYIEGYKPPQDLRDPTLFVSAEQKAAASRELRRREFEDLLAQSREAAAIREQGGFHKVAPAPVERILPSETDLIFPGNPNLRLV